MFVAKIFVHPLIERGLKFYTQPCITYMSNDPYAIQRAIDDLFNAAGITGDVDCIEQVRYEIPRELRDLEVIQSTCPIYFIESEADNQPAR